MNERYGVRRSERFGTAVSYLHRPLSPIRDVVVSVPTMAESPDITAGDARTAAQMEADVGAEHIADVYAKALLDTTERAGQTAAVIEEFDAMMAEVVGRFPKLEAVLDSILVSAGRESGADRQNVGRPRVADCWSISSRSWPGMAGSTVCGPSTARRTSSTTTCGTASPSR